MRSAALLLAFVQAVHASESSHAPCDCGASAVADDSLAYKTCRSTGDPHYSGWDNKRFNFYGFGAYRLAKAPITRCGCDLDVQTFTGSPTDLGAKAATAAAGASSNVAVAARFGAVVMTIRGDDRSIHLHDASTGTDVRSGFDEWGASDQQDVLEAQYGIGRVGHRPDADGSERGFRGWKVAVPGGGELLTRISNQGIIGIWLTLPGDSTGNRGLCAEDFTPDSYCAEHIRPTLPSTKCTTKKACVPLFHSESLFDAETLKNLERKYLRPGLGTRRPSVEAKCNPPNDPPPDASVCVDEECTSLCTRDGAAATATVPLCPDSCPDGELCPSSCVPDASKHQGRWWSSADRYVQCRDKLWESPSAEEIDPAKVERCADPNCGNTCQKNHCQKVATLRWLKEKGQTGVEDLMGLTGTKASSTTPAFQYKSWVVGCTLAHFMAAFDKQACLDLCKKRHACKDKHGNSQTSNNDMLKTAGIMAWNGAPWGAYEEGSTTWNIAPTQLTGSGGRLLECGSGAGGCPGSSRRCDSGDCCDDDTGTAKKICMKACGYYMEDLGVTGPTSNGDMWPQFGMNDWQPPVIDPSCMGRAGIHGYASTHDSYDNPCGTLPEPCDYRANNCNTDVQIVRGPKSNVSPIPELVVPHQPINSCGAWCAELAKNDPKVSTKLHSGSWKDYKLFCGFVASGAGNSKSVSTKNGQCMAIVGRQLAFYPYYFSSTELGITNEYRGGEYMLKGDDITVVDQYKYLQSTSRAVYQYHLSYHAPTQPCDIDPDELPEYELPPEDLCELTGSALAEVELVCEHVCPELRDECIYDACVYGIDDPAVQSFAEMTQDACETTTEICQNQQKCGQKCVNENCDNSIPPPPRTVRVECDATDGKPPRTCLYRSDRPPRYPCCTTCEGGSCPAPTANAQVVGAAPVADPPTVEFLAIPGSAAGPSVGASGEAAGVQFGG